MIREDLYPAAHKAIHHLVLEGRSLAGGNASHSRIAKLLDDVEYLIGMLYDSEDSTERFRSYLDGVTAEFGWRIFFDEFATQVGEPIATNANAD